MQISLLALAKADTRLRDALIASGGAEGLRVLLTLRGKEVAQQPAPRPESFASREDYRRALIEQRTRFIEESIGDVLRELRGLGLRVIETTITRTVIADGTASQVARALEVPGVEKAALEQSLELIRPVPLLPASGAESKE